LLLSHIITPQFLLIGVPFEALLRAGILSFALKVGGYLHGGYPIKNPGAFLKTRLSLYKVLAPCHELPVI
jgi:hypothetical protein